LLLSIAAQADPPPLAFLEIEDLEAYEHPRPQVALPLKDPRERGSLDRAPATFPKLPPPSARPRSPPRASRWSTATNCWLGATAARARRCSSSSRAGVVVPFEIDSWRA
jgi:hypothetical protein